MNQSTADRRTWWLLAGLVAGVALSSLWPAEPLQAVATDREERFAIATTDTGLNQPESVFVLDFLTGRMVGATLNAQTSQFSNFYFRQVTGDFQLEGSAKPKFVMIPGRAELNSGRGTTTSTGVIYIGELTSGKVVAYRFPVRITRTPSAPVPMEAFAYFAFRDATTEN
jgi:hypothetical protein